MALTSVKMATAVCHMCIMNDVVGVMMNIGLHILFIWLHETFENCNFKLSWTKYGKMSTLLVACSLKLLGKPKANRQTGLFWSYCFVLWLILEYLADIALAGIIDKGNLRQGKKPINP